MNSKHNKLKAEESIQQQLQEEIAFMIDYEPDQQSQHEVKDPVELHDIQLHQSQNRSGVVRTSKCFVNVSMQTDSEQQVITPSLRRYRNFNKTA